MCENKARGSESAAEVLGLATATLPDSLVFPFRSQVTAAPASASQTSHTDTSPIRGEEQSLLTWEPPSLRVLLAGSFRPGPSYPPLLLGLTASPTQNRGSPSPPAGPLKSKVRALGAVYIPGVLPVEREAFSN